MAIEEIRVCIVEDDPQDLAVLRYALTQFADEKGIRLMTTAYADGADIPRDPPLDIDILFLDIEMKQQDGMSAAHSIREIDEDVMIFFVTKMIQFALEGYTVNASAFIVKPLRYPTLKSHMLRALATLERRRSHLVFVKSGREQTAINGNRVTFIETDKKRTLIHTEQEDIPCSETLQALERKFDSGHFFRVHASFLINMDFVDTVVANDVIVDGSKIPISKYRKRLFLATLTNYKGRLL